MCCSQLASQLSAHIGQAIEGATAGFDACMCLLQVQVLEAMRATLAGSKQRNRQHVIHLCNRYVISPDPHTHTFAHAELYIVSLSAHATCCSLSPTAASLPHTYQRLYVVVFHRGCICWYLRLHVVPAACIRYTYWQRWYAPEGHTLWTALFWCNTAD